MSVIVLLLAIASGVSGTLFTRASKGFKRWGHGIAAVGGYTIATIAMSWLVQRLPVGIVYAAWSGCAAVALIVIDRWFFDERVQRRQVAGVALTLAGVVLLSLALR